MSHRANVHLLPRCHPSDASRDIAETKLSREGTTQSCHSIHSIRTITQSIQFHRGTRSSCISLVRAAKCCVGATHVANVVKQPRPAQPLAHAISTAVAAASSVHMNPITELQTVYQRLKLPLPRYEFVEAPCTPAANTRYVCNLFAQCQVGDTDKMEEQVYQGEGTAKKAAKANAATAALEMLRHTPMYTRGMAPAKDTPLWDIVEQVLSDEALKKDPRLRTYVLWAQAYSPGAVLPLSAVTHARPVRTWLKQRAPDTLDDHHAMTHALATRLLTAQQRRGPAAAASGIAVVGKGEAGLGVRRTQHFAQAGALEAHGLVDDVESAYPAMVLLPADASLPPQELRTTAGGDVLGKLSTALGCHPTHLIIWGHVGRKIYYVATPAQLAEQQQRQQRQAVQPDEVLLQTLEQQEEEQQQQNMQQGVQQRDFWEEPPAKRRHITGNVDSQAYVRKHSGPAVMDWDDNEPEVKGPVHVAQAAAIAGTYESHGGHVIKMAEPVLYSVSLEGGQQAAAVNLRASWLAGRPVRGDALLSLCRVSTSQLEGAHLIRWSDYTLADYWRSASGTFPSAEYRRGVHSPLLHRLPERYREPSSWVGSAPCHLLDAYIQRHAWSCSQTYTVEHNEASNMYMVKLQVVAFGTGAPVEVQAEHASEPIAKQQAALAMLHRLERVDAAALLADEQNDAIEQLEHPGDREAEQLEVVEPGEEGHMLPAPGLNAKVDAHLFITAANAGSDVAGAGRSAADYTVEHRPVLNFELGCAAVMPALEAAVMSLRVKDTARCSVLVALEGADPLRKFEPVPCTLHVQLLSVSRPKLSADGPVSNISGRALFDVPLSVQRYELVAKMVQDTGARTVVDLGCGEGRLIAHLLRNCAFTSLQRIIGIDCSDNAMQLASKGLERLVVRLSTMVELPLQHEQQQEQQGQEQQEQEQPEQPGPSWQGALGARQGSAGGMPPYNSQTFTDDGPAQEAGPSRADTNSTDQPQVAEWGRGGVVGGGRTLDRQASVQQALRRGQSQTLSTSGPVLPPSFTCQRSDAPSAISIVQPSSQPTPATATSDSTLDGGDNEGAAVWSVQVSLAQTDFAAQAMTQPEAWGPLAGCDLATLVEVIEHLDPLPLALTAPALLGGLRPKVAIVTTPNYEYNQVLTAARSLAIQPGPAAAEFGVEDADVDEAGAGAAAPATAPAVLEDALVVTVDVAAAEPSVSYVGSTGTVDAVANIPSSIAQAAAAGQAGATRPSEVRVLRNSDHRFEWMRAEFRRWAHEAAGAFGYDVAFEDIGHVQAEEDVVGAKGWDGGKDVGAAVQVAVFTRRGGVVGAPGVRLPAPAWGPRRLAVVVGGEGEGVAAAEESNAQQGQAALDVDDVPVEHF